MGTWPIISQAMEKKVSTAPTEEEVLNLAFGYR